MKADTPDVPPRSPADTPPTGQGPPRHRGSGLLALLLLYAAILAPLPFQAPPDARPRSAPDTGFSAERAMDHVAVLARAPRPLGSPRHDSARAYLARELEALGLEVRLDSAVVLGGGGGAALPDRPIVAASVRNVLARLPGGRRVAGGPDAGDPGAPLSTLAFLAHYDSRDLTPGAGDDATGVAAILEAVRALRAGPPLRNDLLVILTDGEETGLFGARSLLERGDPWVTAADVVINVEMRGAGGRAILFQTGPGNLALVREAAAADPTLRGSSLYTEIYRRMPNDTDFTPFLRHGYTGLNFAGIEAGTRYHHPSDTPANLDPGTLQDHGNHLVALGRHLGDRELEPLTRSGPDAVFHDVAGLGMVVHSVEWAIPLALLTLLSWVAVLWWTRRRAGWIGPFAGLAWAVGALLLGAGAGWLVVPVGRAIRPGWGTLGGAAAWAEGPLFLLLVLAVVALGLALLSATLLLRAVREAGDGGVALGAALPALLGGAALSVLAPGTSMILVWPAALATGGAALALVLPPPGRVPLLRPLALALPAFAVAWLLVPLVRGLWIGLSLSAGVVLGVVAALALTLVVPLLTAAVRPMRVGVPVTAVVAAALALAFSLPARAPSANRPLPSALLHLQDRESGEARWAAPDLGPLPEWALDRVGWGGDPVTIPDFVPGWSLRHHLGPAPFVEVSGPDVEVERVDGVRYRISIRSRVGAERLSLFPAGGGSEAGGRLRLVSVEGAAVPDARRVGWELIHLGRPIGGTLEVEVEAEADRETAATGPDPGAGGSATFLVLVEHRLRPAELLGSSWPLRPPGLVADIRTLTDRTLFRSRIRLPEG